MIISQETLCPAMWPGVVTLDLSSWQPLRRGTAPHGSIPGGWDWSLLLRQTTAQPQRAPVYLTHTVWLSHVPVLITSLFVIHNFEN